MADSFPEKSPGNTVTMTDRRGSAMTIEESLSYVSTNSNDDSTSIRPGPVATQEQKDADRLALSRHISQTSYTGAIGGVVPNRLTPTVSRRSAASSTRDGDGDPAFEVDFTGPDDKRNPRNWSLAFKCMVIFMMSYSTTAVVLYSSSYTSAIPGMQEEWGISQSTGILGVSTYLFGLAAGAVVLAPLSEMYGRRPIYLITTSLFLVFVVACAVAPNITTILVIRFFGAFCASALVSNAPGSVSDIVDEDYRALAFSVWSVGPINGPVLGPVIGGFAALLGWRWTNWVVLIGAAVGLGMQIIVPETYAPVILRRLTEKKRRESNDDRYWCRFDDKQEFIPALKVNLSRPFVLTVTEPICIFWDLYIALVYGILYLCFVAYPIVFSEIRGWSSSITGLAFLGIGVGCLITIACEPLCRRIINSHPLDPETGKPYPEAMVSVVCVAAILIPTGEIIFAWTCTPNVHWIFPILAGIPFGMGNAGVFIYATNYLVQSYNIYAASALAGNAVARSIMGAVLPLAGPALYHALGANWAGTLLGLLEAACIPIPFIFYRYGRRIRERSGLIRAMEAERRRDERRDRRRNERLAAAAADDAEKRAEADAMAGTAMFTGAAVVEVAGSGKAARAEEKRIFSSSSFEESEGRRRTERDLEKGRS